jgi:cytochrome c-type biogenesis protein CcmH/NrfG
VQVANLLGLWQTVRMTNQHASQQQRPQHREDYKVQKLIQRIETKMTLQAKANREAKQGNSKN